jgi:SM-20-related protein
LGGAGDRTVDPSIRGDEIRWWPDDVNDLGPQAAQLRARLDELREAINGSLYLGLKRAEIHFAHYPPGAGYARHVDRPRGSGDRMVSGVLYLNLDWKTADGGELALWPQDGAEARVEPRAGTLVTFLSEDLPHQVMPAHRDRWSVTFWLSRASAPGLI